MTQKLSWKSVFLLRNNWKMLLLSLPRLMVTSKLSAETQDFIEFSFFTKVKQIWFFCQNFKNFARKLSQIIFFPLRTEMTSFHFPRLMTLSSLVLLPKITKNKPSFFAEHYNSDKISFLPRNNLKWLYSPLSRLFNFAMVNFSVKNQLKMTLPFFAQT